MIRNVFHARKIARSAIGAGIVGTLAACSGILGLTDPALDNGVGSGPFDASGNPDANSVEAATGGDGGACSGADLTSDGKNCGTCGHDCLGGACSASACQPVLVAESKSGIAPLYMIENDDVLYFTSTRPPDLIANVGKVPKTAIVTDGGAPTFSILGQFGQADGGNMYGAYPYELAISGSTLLVSVNANAYLGNNYYGGVLKCSITDCSDTTNLTVPNIDSVAVATNGTFAVYDGQHVTGNDMLYVANPDLAAPTAVDIGTAQLGTVVIHESSIFVASSEGVLTFDPAVSTVTHLTTFESDRLAVYGDNVYFTSALSGNPTIQSVAKSGADAGAITVLASGSDLLETPISIAVDTQYFYVADEGDLAVPTSGRVFRCPLAGCGAANANAVVLSTGAAAGGNPRTVVNDPDALYWGDRVGQIWKVAK